MLSGGFRRISPRRFPLSPPPPCQAVKNNAWCTQSALHFRKSFQGTTFEAGQSSDLCGLFMAPSSVLLTVTFTGLNTLSLCPLPCVGARMRSHPRGPGHAHRHRCVSPIHHVWFLCSLQVGTWACSSPNSPRLPGLSVFGWPFPTNTAGP